MNRRKEIMDSGYRLCLRYELDMRRFHVDYEESPETLFVRDCQSAVYLAIERGKTRVEYPSHKEGEFFTFVGDQDECFKTLRFLADVIADVRLAVSRSF